MTNPTVKEVIEFLQTCNPDAIVCRLTDDSNEPYSTIETIYKIGRTKYIDDAGNEAEGEIVSIY